MKVLVPLADGFEEIEAITIIDVMRRAGIEVVTADLRSPDQPRFASGAHGVVVQTEVSFDDLIGEEHLEDSQEPHSIIKFAAIILPGGMPGAATLRDDARVIAALGLMHCAGRTVGAICAAPIALAKAGILEATRATAYPAFRDQLGGAIVVENERVVIEDDVITSSGPGTAMEFALTLVRELVGAERAEAIAEDMLVEDFGDIQIVGL